MRDVDALVVRQRAADDAFGLGEIGAAIDDLEPDLAIVDGIIGMEGDGPIMGTPRHAGVLVMGTNLPAVDATAAVPFVIRGIMLWSLGGICGYIAFGFICDIIGRRLTVILYSAGTIVFGLILYLALPAYEPWYPVVLPIFGFFVFGVFSGYAVYLPELFPTHIRSTAVGFCTGSARIVTSFGPLVAGLLVGAFGGSFNRVTAFMTCFALLSILAMLLGRETKGNPLPR